MSNNKNSQRANILTFGRGVGGVFLVSQLHSVEEQGAVIICALGQDQTSRVLTCTRLPEKVKNCVDVSILQIVTEQRDENTMSSSPQAPSKSVYVVLEKAYQTNCAPRDVQISMLPEMIIRTKKGIPDIIDPYTVFQSHIAKT